MNEEQRKQVEELIASAFSRFKGELSSKLAVLESIEKSGVFEFKDVRIIGGALNIGGGNQVEGATAVPLVILDDSGLATKRGAGYGIATTSKGLNAEQINGVLVVQKVDKEPPSDLSGNETPPKQSANMLNETEVFINHNSFDDVGYNSFVYALRTPIVVGNGRVANGGTVLTDLSQSWEVDELVGAVLYLTGSTTEAYIVASNTANTITITGGTWQSASNEYVYQVSWPVYLGSATGPWRRLYVKDDIRFGIGPSNGTTVIWIKQGAGSPEGVVTANVGSLYMRTDGALGTCLYVKESGTGNTGWHEVAFGSKKEATTVGAGFTLTPVSGYHVLTGTAARTSDGTTAITDGAFAGQILILQGTSDTNTITIQQAANCRLAGAANAVLGANDTLMLVWDGTDWIEVSRSNNT